MASKDVYGHVNNKTDLKQIFTEINDDVDHAKKRGDLTELYRRAGYLITLSYAPSWEKKFGDKADDLRETAEKQFTKTAKHINKQAKKVGTDGDYDEQWGKMKKKGH